MDRKIKEYIESGKALQRKYDLIKFGKLTKHEEMVERFKPITDTLNILNENMRNAIPKTSTSGEKVIPKTSTSGEDVGSIDEFDKKKSDKIFGIRVENKNMYVGNSRISITPDNNIVLESDHSLYKRTPGLWELLTLENPQNYSESDMSSYEQIILRSYAYKRNNDRHNKYVKSSTGQKYLNIIKPILLKNNIIKSTAGTAAAAVADEEFVYKKGSGLRKFNTNQPVEYVHWNTVDELVDRLCHLWGEVQAGNTNPLLLNEIVNIIQEFKEL